MKKNDLLYMKLAMRLARTASGETSPNPLVGAVVVKAGRVVGRGYHKKAGQAHAEVMALDAAGSRARGATLYVTLEPCAHYGRTPPCVERVIASGVARAVIGMVDPNPLVNGRGIELLRKHGVLTEVGTPLEEELRAMNKPFLKFITHKMPLVTVKVGQSLDGNIATRDGDSKWITSDEARAFAHRARKDYDAIMIGSNTLLRDNPKLDPWYSSRKLTKIIVDSQLSTPADANIFSSGSPVIIVTLPAAPGQETENRANLAARGAHILEARETGGQINLRDMLKKVARLGITNIIVEGGGTLIGSLFDEKLVDRVMFFVSPRIIGGADATGSVMGKGVGRVEQAFKLRNLKVRRIGPDFLFEGDVC